MLLQGYPDLEYMIIDGGSTDGSVDIIRKYEPWLSYWVSVPDNGQSHAIQKGLERATGTLMNWLNSDDFLWPGALIALAEAWASSDEPAKVLCGDGEIVDVNSQIVREKPVTEAKHKLLPMAPPLTGGTQGARFWTAEAWRIAGRVNPWLEYTMDSELYYRFWAQGASFQPVKSRIAARRYHDATKTARGWRQSVRAKRGFYEWLLAQLSDEQERLYRKRVRQHLANMYLNSVVGSDGWFSRSAKIVMALRETPALIVRKRGLRRLVKVLRG